MKQKKTENLSKIAVKNSAYTFASIAISKIGALIFTIVVARLLLPELFGVYSLVLSIIIIAMTFTDFGINSASIKYVSEELGRDNKDKARSYFKYLLKIKGTLIFLVILIVLLMAKFLSYNVFNKPLIFLPLIFASLFILMESARDFFGTLFIAKKDFQPLPLFEFVIQLSKIIFSITAITILSDAFKVSGIFVAFALSGFIYLLLSLSLLLKRNKEFFFGKKVKIEKSRVLNYIKFVSLTTISLAFFGAIDILMLGKFVEASYIGYYRVAIGLAFTVSALLSFSGILLPIFTQINKERLERGFQKVFRYIIMLAIPAAFGLIFMSGFAVFFLYGKEYMPSVYPLYILSLLIITSPLFEIYSILFKAKEKQKILAKFTFIALILNIFLNYILIKSFLLVSQEYAIFGAAIATLASRTFLLGFLIIKTKSQFKINLEKSHFIKPILATVVMVTFLIIFNNYVNLNFFLGIIEIFMAILIYFTSLKLLKGVNTSDFELIKQIFKK